MCGIVGIVARFDPERLAAPELLEGLAGVEELHPELGLRELERRLLETVEVLRPLRGFPACAELLARPELQTRYQAAADVLTSIADGLEARLVRGAVDPRELEATNRVLTLSKDAAWRLSRDFLAARPRLLTLLRGDTARPKLQFEMWRLDLIFQALALLEVRGRDSSGLAVLVRLPAGAIEQLPAALQEDLQRRQAIREHKDGAVTLVSNDGACLAFSIKIAAEIGELGSNVETLRAKVRDDDLLRAALGHPEALANVFAHTRWASNGIINEANAHPHSNGVLASGSRPYFVAASVNGDVDNYQPLRAMLADKGLHIPEGTTSDAKVIPVLFDLELLQQAEPLEAFRRTVGLLEGSLAICAHTSQAPGLTLLALKGSGQGLYVGELPEGYMFASELYGLVELTERFHRLEGERPHDPARPQSRGHILALDAESSGLRSLAFDGSEVPLGEPHIAEITTRDVDRAHFPHFFLKEISESPDSVRRTLRGRFLVSHSAEGHARFEFRFGNEAIPDDVVRALVSGELRRIITIGQGTASIAAMATAYLAKRLLKGSKLEVLGMKSTELSGFELDDLGPETLVVAVSQSGTTTDTNRTVEMVRERGGRVLAIVNRRGSDLSARADGVIYTSSGRDVEMSVASTKAFYSQVVAGYLLGLFFAHKLGTISEDEIAARLSELDRLPELLERVLLESQHIKAIAREHAVRKRYWACVGSGPTKPAADEIRIKLSELCYKSIGVDTIEDKKHIDLSSEPLILVCAAGLSGHALADVVKEIAIFKAHKACPIVICEQGEERFAPYAAAVIPVPLASEAPSLLLNTVAGHLFGYYSALAIDETAQPLRRMRAEVERTLRGLLEDPSARIEDSLAGLRQRLVPLADQFRAGLLGHAYDTGLEVRTVARLSLLLECAVGVIAIDDMARWLPELRGPEVLLDLLLLELSAAIDQLQRPIDVIKHQAKTVTVGISRTEDAPRGSFADSLRAAGGLPQRLLYRDRLALRVLGPLVASVDGATRYKVFGLDNLGMPGPAATIFTEAQTGIAEQIPSRSSVPGPLKGTKRRVVTRRQLWLGVGKRDGRDLVILPLVADGTIDGLLLLHVRFVADASLGEKVDALKNLGARYEELRCAVTEWDTEWDESLLEDLPVRDLLALSPEELARSICKA